MITILIGTIIGAVILLGEFLIIWAFVLRMERNEKIKARLEGND